MPKISVIAPIYNDGLNLPLCIKSVLEQTFTNFELILVDYGHEDNNRIIYDKYSNLDSRISVIHSENRDIGAARNIGISHSSGEYITFIECDDFLHEQMLEVLYDQMVTTAADIVLCNFHPIEEGEDKNENRRKDPVQDYSVTTFSGAEALNGLYDTDRLFSVPWSKMYRKTLFKSIQYPIGYVDDDEFVAHKLLYLAAEVVYVHEPLYYYVVCEGRKGSVTPIPMTIEKFDKLLALYERAIFFREKKLKDVEEKSLLHFSEHFFWYYLQSQKELPNANDRRKEIKKLYNKLFFRLMNNPRVSIKKKIVYGAFRISPSIHKLLISRLENKKLAEQL
ncbi:glycosyltransferase family 2 protein [Virgibacillus sp. W0181]|uniref:glycosyltransferase family 2 protein n=1 Tax=Virgibacillus sp. W0181 TaxID=3391581 RepID=UPI003F47E625